MKTDTITGLYKLPGKKAEARVIPNTLEALQELVGGYIETVSVPIGSGCIFICNEEGKLRGMDPNFYYRGDIFVGPVFICCRSGEEFSNLQLHDCGMKTLLAILHNNDCHRMPRYRRDAT